MLSVCVYAVSSARGLKQKRQDRICHTEALVLHMQNI